MEYTSARSAETASTAAPAPPTQTLNTPSQDNQVITNRSKQACFADLGAYYIHTPNGHEGNFARFTISKTVDGQVPSPEPGKSPIITARQETTLRKRGGYVHGLSRRESESQTRRERGSPCGPAAKTTTLHPVPFQATIKRRPDHYGQASDTSWKAYGQKPSGPSAARC